MTMSYGLQLSNQLEQHQQPLFDGYGPNGESVLSQTASAQQPTLLPQIDPLIDGTSSTHTDPTIYTAQTDISSWTQSTFQIADATPEEIIEALKIIELIIQDTSEDAQPTDSAPLDRQEILAQIQQMTGSPNMQLAQTEFFSALWKGIKHIFKPKVLKNVINIAGEIVNQIF